VAQANKRCGLSEMAPVVSGDEAGREGCWRHRCLPAHCSPNAVVDFSAIAALGASVGPRAMRWPGASGCAG
jgi:hypothetical protein